MTERTARVIISAVDRASEPVRRINAAINTITGPIRNVSAAFGGMGAAIASNGIVAGLNRVSDAARNVGAAMTMNLSLPIAAAGGLTLRTALTFEQSMNRIAALTEAPADQLARLRDLAQELGSSTVFSSKQVADAMAELGASGMTTEQIIASTAGVLDLAASSGTDLARAAEITASTLGQFRLEAAASGRVADVLAHTAAATQTTLESVAQSMQYAGPIAARFGMTLEQTAGAIGLLGNIGIRGSEAGTALRTALTGLAAPSSEASKVLRALEVNTKDAAGNMLPFADILTQFGRRIASLGSGEQLQAIETLFGREGITGAAELISQAGSGRLQEFARELQNVEGRAARLAAIMNGGAPGAVANFTGALELLQLRIAESGLLKWFEDTITALTGWINALSNADKSILKWGTVILGVVAGLGPLLIAIGFVAKGFALMSTGAVALVAGFALVKGAVVGTAAGIGMVFASFLPIIAGVFQGIAAVIAANPITASILAIGAAVYVVYKNWDGIVAYFTAKLSAVRAAFEDGFLNGIGAILAQFNPVGLISDAVFGLISWMTGVDFRDVGAKWINSILASLSPAWETVTSWFGAAWEVLRRRLMENVLGEEGVAMVASYLAGISSAWTSLASWVSTAWEGLRSWFGSLSLVEVGSSLIQGLWNGIRSRWDAMTAWLAGAINGLTEWMPNWVRDRLGMGSGGPVRVPGPDAGRAPAGLSPAGAALGAALAAPGALAAPVALPPMAPIVVPAVPSLLAGSASPEALRGGSGSSATPAGVRPSSPALAARSGPDGASGATVSAPVSVNVTVNGQAEPDVIRREVEEAVRQALREMTSRSGGGSASLYD